MLNANKTLAKSLSLLSVDDFINFSDKIVANELGLLDKKKDLCHAYSTLSQLACKKSLIKRSLKGAFNPLAYKIAREEASKSDSASDEKVKQDSEDIISEALLLLREASLKYFEKDRDCNFEQFAVVHISGGIKNYRSKWNGYNGSDRNELIHSAIRSIKKLNCQSGKRLNFFEAKKLAKHFNLCKENGHKVIWELESKHLEKKSDWKIVDIGEGDEEVHVSEIFKKGNSIPNINLSHNIKSIYNSPEIRSSAEQFFINDEKKNRKKIINKFFNKYLKSYSEKLIFEKRMYCFKEDECKLKDLSKILNISVQRISIIEKNLKEKFKYFYSIEKFKSEDIK